ncbi:DNA-binding transcriptional regulator KdgR [Phytohabitans flavus]|uniref:DNA-binding transcriptional regulator KdgR n=2 Tax=Phytohabitans flavus TaxID=1076124 RepID=A0A6F8XN93_9ACTN|nr:DNA-binding transcriptional regulator KdgR [Phytohabitans flavus]
MAAAGRDIGVSDLARRTGLTKASVYSILTTLETRHVVVRDPDTARYRLSWGLYVLGATVARDSDLLWAARPLLNGLAEATGETVLLGILDEKTVLHLDRAESSSGLRMVANIGRRSPLHATASGKVLLAWQPESVVNRLLDGELRRYSRNTITDPKELLNQLAVVRERGYGGNWQEYEIGLCSIAVPLHDHTGEVVGALTLAGPAQRLTPRSVKRQLKPLSETAESIEKRLGARISLNGSAVR